GTGYFSVLPLEKLPVPVFTPVACGSGVLPPHHPDCHCEAQPRQSRPRLPRRGLLATTSPPGWLGDRTRSLSGLCRTLPEQVVPELLGLGAHGGQCGELAVEDFVGMGFFVILERAPIGHDDIVVVCGFGRIEGSFGGEKARELEDLPRDEAPFATAVGFLDDAAQ